VDGVDDWEWMMGESGEEWRKVKKCEEK